MADIAEVSADWCETSEGFAICGTRMKEHSRRSMGEKWCFHCRKRHNFDWVVMAPDGPSYYGPDVEIEVRQPEAIFLMASRKPGLTVEAIAREFGLETLRDYLARSAAMREARLRGHKPG